MTHFDDSSSVQEETQTRLHGLVPAGNARLHKGNPSATSKETTNNKQDTVLDLRLKSTKSNESTSVEVSNDLIDLVEKIITGVKGLFK